MVRHQQVNSSPMQSDTDDSYTNLCAVTMRMYQTKGLIPPPCDKVYHSFISKPKPTAQ